MKILYVTTIGLTMTFFQDLIGKLLDEGNTVDIICNESEERVPDCYRNWGCRVYHHPGTRSVLSGNHIQAIKEIETLVERNGYDIVHCHTPIAAACTRIACRKARKSGTKVFYTAHGFHFFKGAPMKNWLLFYPVEWLCSFWTDVLITINQEDFTRAKKLHAKRIEYVPGVGLDLNRFGSAKVSKEAKRKELGVPEDAFVLLSVGEINQNKNHQVIIRAMAEVKNPQLHYWIAGRGDQREPLESLAKELGLDDCVHFLGYRNDIDELCAASDAFCFPSKREGLGMAALEAMARGLPVVTSNIHGIKDYSFDGITGYTCAPDDVRGFATAIKKLMDDRDGMKAMSEHNKQSVRQFSKEIVLEKMMDIYSGR